MTTATVERHPDIEPLAGHAIDVVLAGGWRLPVRADGVTGPGDVALVPLNGTPVLPGGAHRVPATVEWCSARGLVRRSGTLLADTDALVLAGAADPVVTQRRNHTRVSCALRVVVESSRTGEDLLTRTIDLSIGGMLIGDASVLQEGERVRIALGLPEQLDLQCAGRVVRAMRFGYRAIAFDAMRVGDETRLSRFVFAQQRAGRTVRED